jgi:hypothetical protein
MLVGCVQGQLTHLDTVDTKELGEVVDMIKDFSEAIYYCTITEAMEGKEKETQQQHHHYYTDYRMMDRDTGRMYYEEGMSNGNHMTSGTHKASMQGNNARGGGSRGYYERELPWEMRDEREGRSHMSRKNYMEAKEMHHDKNVKLKELEKYMQELSNDMVEMISDTSPEEKQLLEKRLAALSSKIGQLNG